MRCENCGGYSSRADSHCRRCGVEMRNLRLPVKRSPAQPTVWSQAAPVLARGVALVALGVAAELALNTLARGALRLPALRKLGGQAQVEVRVQLGLRDQDLLAAPRAAARTPLDGLQLARERICVGPGQTRSCGRRPSRGLRR